MTVRQAVEATTTTTQLLNATRVASGTVVNSTPVDVRTFAAGTRFLVTMTALGVNSVNTGGTWSIQESATSGGSFTAAATNGSLAATGATAAGNVVRAVSYVPHPDRPFVLARFTPADANARVDISAVLIGLPRAMV